MRLTRALGHHLLFVMPAAAAEGLDQLRRTRLADVTARGSLCFRYAPETREIDWAITELAVNYVDVPSTSCAS